MGWASNGGRWGCCAVCYDAGCTVLRGVLRGAVPCFLVCGAPRCVALCTLCALLCAGVRDGWLRLLLLAVCWCGAAPHAALLCG